MNREIKFRAWCETDNGEEMIYFDKLECDNGLWFGYDKKHINEHINLMQFTGLQDKNGKDIYEGDILFGREEGDGETTAWTDVYLIVFFKDGCFKTRQNKIDEVSCWCDNLCEEGITDYYNVIGNIHDNPNLLTQ